MSYDSCILSRRYVSETWYACNYYGTLIGSHYIVHSCGVVANDFTRNRLHISYREPFRGHVSRNNRSDVNRSLLYTSTVTFAVKKTVN